ncbi:MAG: hypothetical protein IPK82_00565 [Polyangiaceae bacterium]|nr:hypothetical protein [Polyangiaceae bacterium]
MKKWVLTQIIARGGNTYEAHFEAGSDAKLSVICTTEESDGIKGISVYPDVFWKEGILARPIAAAVRAFHNARQPPEEEK